MGLVCVVHWKLEHNERLEQPGKLLYNIHLDTKDKKCPNMQINQAQFCADGPDCPVCEESTA
jgi:hypothetical protein